MSDYCPSGYNDPEDSSSRRILWTFTVSSQLQDMRNRFQLLLLNEPKKPSEAALPLCTCSSLDMLQIVQLSPLTRRVKGQLERPGLGGSASVT